MLNAKTIGLKLIQAFTQNKDELIIHLSNESAEGDFYVKTLMSPSFTCLSFPNEFKRTKRNSVNLFTELYNLKVTGVYQYENERAFCLEFENQYSLVFKMFGNQSNIVLFKNRHYFDMFQKKMRKDEKLTLPLDRVLDVTFESFVKDPDLKKWFPTLRGLPEAYLETMGFTQLKGDEKWKIIQDTQRDLLNPSKYYLIKHNGRLRLSLLAFGQIIHRENDIVNASNEFFRIFISEDSLTKEKRRVLLSIQKEINKSENFILKAENRIVGIREESNYQQIGDIIMANLHDMKLHQTPVKLFNFYSNSTIEIKVKTHLSPQLNAEMYYRKAKNQFLEVKVLQENLKERKLRLKELFETYKKVEACNTLKELKIETKHLKSKTSRKQDQEPIPYYERKMMGFRILIGKNAKSNDKLLKLFSRKEDLWLHVKDAAGSHVIIKQEAGKEFSKELIEKAAQIAAYYSKRKSEALVPVTFTPRKYVRKRKGDPPGMVVVDKEKVILTSPLSNPI